MPHSISITVIIILSIIFLVSLALFFREWKYPVHKEYKERSVRKFMKSSATTIYLLIATVAGLAIISIAMLVINS